VLEVLEVKELSLVQNATLAETVNLEPSQCVQETLYAKQRESRTIDFQKSQILKYVLMALP
jgi:hypothetical protein